MISTRVSRAPLSCICMAVPVVVAGVIAVSVVLVSVPVATLSVIGVVTADGRVGSDEDTERIMCIGRDGRRSPGANGLSFGCV